jgi:type III secretion protein Q
LKDVYPKMMDTSLTLLPIEECSTEKAKLGRMLSRLAPSIQLEGVSLSLRLEKPKLDDHIKLVLSLPRALDFSVQEVACRISLDQAYQWMAEWMGGADVEAIPRSLLVQLLPERFHQSGDPLRALLGEHARFESCTWEAQFRSQTEKVLLVTQTLAGKPLDIWFDQGVEDCLQRWPKVPLLWPTKGNVQLTTLVGAVALESWEYGNLGIGDVVFFDQCLIPQSTVAIKINGVQCWQGTFEGASITLTESLNTPLLEQEETMVSDLEQIPVNLEFEIGSARMNLNEVAQLQPGYVFELNETTDQPVKVLVGNQVVGRGELVSLNNKLGVRLTTWHGDKLNPPAESSEQ